MSVIGYRGGAQSEAAADVKVSSGLYEFLLRHTRGRVRGINRYRMPAFYLLCLRCWYASKRAGIEKL